MNIVRKSLITEASQLELSAGLVIVQKGTILLCHPTNQKWYGTYSIPKGHVQEGEDLIDAAIRETKEEVGIVIDKRDIIDKKPKFIDYKDKTGKLYKRVYYFLANPSEIIQQAAIIPDKTEVDWAGFITPEKAEHRILWRLKPVLTHIDEITEKEKERIKKKKEKEEKKKEEEDIEKGEDKDTNKEEDIDLDLDL
jgi:ADP-ribose pyrophosphatase YjhB (NUDIX family)